MKKNSEKTPTETKNEQPAQSEMEVALTQENEKLIAEVERLTAENAKLQSTCNRLQSSADKSDTYLNQLVAMKSDFESYKRRMRANNEQSKQEGVQSVVVKLIDVCDNYELARQHLTEENAKAFEMIHAQFLQILDELGVQQMQVLGQPFDCNKMNALSKLDRGEENTDKVVEVYKQGYLLGDKVIRYAEVIVGA